jgi:hypothetical protein
VHRMFENFAVQRVAIDPALGMRGKPEDQSHE